MRTLLQTNSLSVHYTEENQAIRDVNVSVPERKIMAVAGESGSGKTTLLKTMAGLLEPTNGVVLFDGKPLPPPSRRLVPGHPDIRMVFQDFGLSPNLTVYQNIAHVLQAYQSGYRKERTEELLIRCHLSQLAHQYPRSLSGGEKQRVALARALAEEPRLLLMDEPFGQLDTLLKQQLKSEIADFLQESSITMVLVTHDPRDALGIADTIVVLQSGRVEQTAAPQQLYEHPATPYVAQLFGPVTIFPTERWQAWFTALPSRPAPRLGVRAERVVISPATGSPAAGVPATVQWVMYQGFYQEVAVRVADGVTITAFHQGEALSAGDKVMVSVQPESFIPFSE